MIQSIGERAANGDRGESWKPESTAALVIKRKSTISVLVT